MKQSYIVFFLFLFSSPVLARKANFIEAHSLRLSGHQNSTQWLLPFAQTRAPTPFEVNVLVSGEKDTYNLYQDLQSKDQQKIQDRLGESYGKPYDASAKIGVNYRFENFSQVISTNGGAVLLATDPVFPELKGFLFHDYTASSSMILKPTPRLVLKPQLNYGIRRVLDAKYSIGDLVDGSLDVKLNEIPFIGFSEFSLHSLYSLSSWGQILFQLNSLPLSGSEISYWDTFLGYKTPNLLDGAGLSLTEASLYTGYSPFYGGNYDVGRTYRVGANILFSDWMALDVFTLDKFYPAAVLAFNSPHIVFEIFTFERSYDDFELQKSRNYGVNLKVKW